MSRESFNTEQQSVALPTQAIAPDCRHYRGDKPCFQNRLCNGCGHYSPYTSRLCIIKLGALGDVIRTLCILPALRAAYPDAQITWISLPNGCRMIADHPLIDRVLPFSPTTTQQLVQEVFDVVINLDKEAEPCSLANAMRASRKLGIALSPFGTPIPANAEAEAYFHLGLSDDLKFHQNTRSYPQLVHEALGLEYNGQSYTLPVADAASERIRVELELCGWNPDRLTIGINVGAGKVFANKMWPVERLIELVRTLRRSQPDTQILLLGGPDERPMINAIGLAVPHRSVIDAGTDHDEPTFVALIDLCDVVFTGDTMAMHVAIARSKSVVAYFGPTCEQEIDLFGRGEKLIARVDCGPCYKRTCDNGHVCVQFHEINDAAEAIGRALPAASTRRFTLPVFPSRKAG